MGKEAIGGSRGTYRPKPTAGHLAPCPLVLARPRSRRSLALRTDYECRQAAVSSPEDGTATLAVSFPSCGFLTNS